MKYNIFHHTHGRFKQNDSSRVIPAKAGIQGSNWTPAFAGVTSHLFSEATVESAAIQALFLKLTPMRLRGNDAKRVTHEWG